LRGNNIKKFKIPVSYEVCGEITVEAKTAKAALKYALKNIDMLELPEHVEYIDGSFEVNEDIDLITVMNKKEEEILEK
jgi:hypothetical protein